MNREPNYWQRLRGRRLPRRTIVGAMAAAAAGTIVGCGDDDDGGEAATPTKGIPLAGSSPTAAGASPAATTPAKPSTDTLTVGVSTLQEQIPDPHLVLGGNLNPVFWSVADTLVRRDLEGKLTPSLATEWKTSDDGLTWTFKLRSGVKMQDGSAFTATDVKTAVDRVKGADFTPFITFNKFVTGADVVDDSTVVIKTNQPYPTLPGDLPAPIPTQYYTKTGDAEFRKKPLAAGAFRFTTQELNASMSFEAFDGYWDATRKPNFKNLILKIVPEESTRVAGLKTGALDIAHGLTPNGAQQIQGGDIKTMRIDGTATMVASCLDLFTPDTPSPFLDVRLRKALLMAIDRPAIVKGLYGGYAAVPDNITFKATLGNNPDKKAVPFDVKQAKDLIAQSGVKNLAVQLHTYTQTTTIADVQKLAESVVAYWQQAGVNATLDAVDANSYLPKYRSHGYTGFGILGFPAFGYFEPVYLNTFYSSTGAYASLKSSKTDELFTKLATTVDLKQREALGRQLSDYVYDELPGLPLVSATTIYGVGPKVAEWQLMQANPYAGPFWYLRAK